MVVPWYHGGDTGLARAVSQHGQTSAEAALPAMAALAATPTGEAPTPSTPGPMPGRAPPTGGHR